MIFFQIDLIELEEQGLITRERGGAMCREVSDTLSAFNEVPTVNKENLCAEAKAAVCSKAVRNVKDGDCVYVDSGTTPVYLLPHLLARKVKIVTPSIYLIDLGILLCNLLDNAREGSLKGPGKPSVDLTITNY